MKPILILMLLGLAGFCAFGFAATFEPMGRDRQLVWRTAYGLVGGASLAGALWIIIKGSRASRGAKCDD